MSATDRVWCGAYDLHPAHSYDTPAGRFFCDASVQGSGPSVIAAPAVPVGVQPATEAATSATGRAVSTRPEPAEEACCSYHATRGTSGALVECQPEPRCNDYEWCEYVCRGDGCVKRQAADHPHTDPGDGRVQCETCGKFVHLVTHSCKGVRVARAVPVVHPEPGPRHAD